MGWEKTKCGAIHEASECQLRERRAYEKERYVPYSTLSSPSFLYLALVILHSFLIFFR